MLKSRVTVGNWEFLVQFVLLCREFSINRLSPLSFILVPIVNTKSQAHMLRIDHSWCTVKEMPINVTYGLVFAMSMSIQVSSIISMLMYSEKLQSMQLTQINRNSFWTIEVQLFGDFYSSKKNDDVKMVHHAELWRMKEGS